MFFFRFLFLDREGSLRLAHLHKGAMAAVIITSSINLLLIVIIVLAIHSL